MKKKLKLNQLSAKKMELNTMKEVHGGVATGVCMCKCCSGPANDAWGQDYAHKRLNPAAQ